MLTNNKLFFKYILSSCPFSFADNTAQKTKTISLVVTNDSFLYLSTHLKLSSVFFGTQLSDIFTYEIPNHDLFKSGLAYQNLMQVNKSQSSLVVYNFHSLYTQDRFFIFVYSNLLNNKSRVLNANQLIDSITELFPAANWLEREASELYGVNFIGKKDLRNLMLQYGDSSCPFQKSFPTIGLKEMYYDPTKDTLIQNPVTVQL